MGLLSNLGGNIAWLKNTLGLSGVNFLPGDFSKATTGYSSSWSQPNPYIQQNSNLLTNKAYDTLRNKSASSQVKTGGTGGGTGEVRERSDQNMGDQGGGDNGQNYDPYGQLRGEIGSGWDNYLSSLDQQLEGLAGQRLSQENIANEQFNIGKGQLDLQKQQGMSRLAGQREEVGQNQKKSLRDVSSNLKNSFMAGNVYLGARGAGDSSAANQYSYALTKLGTQARGDVMGQSADILNDIAGREMDLDNIYNTEVNKLESEKNIQIQEVSQWFANAQQTIQQQKASGQMGKSQDLASLSKDILNQAMSALGQVQQYALNKKAALDQWAMNNSTTLQQLKSNMSAVSSPEYNMPTTSPITGTPQMGFGGSINVPGYGYSTDEQKKGLFG